MPVLTVCEFFQLIFGGRLRNILIVDDKHDNIPRLIFDWRNQDATQKPSAWNS